MILVDVVSVNKYYQCDIQCVICLIQVIDALVLPEFHWVRHLLKVICRSPTKGKKFLCISVMLTSLTCFLFHRPDHSHSHQRNLMHSVNSSPSSSRRLIRPNSVTSNLNSIQTCHSMRRASTSSNDSASSICSASLVTSQSEKCDSLVSSEHSSLSSSHSLNSYSAQVQPDRNNNNIKELSNISSFVKPQMLPHSKSSPNKKRVLSIPDNSSRIPKSKSSAVKLKTPCTPSPKVLSSVQKVKSTSTLAIPQLSSSKIPCLDATNKPRPVVASRYSTNNIFLAVSQEPDKCDANKSARRSSLCPAVPVKHRSRVQNLSRNKQKSSIELNVNNENFYSMSQTSKLLEQMPNKPQKATYQQHRRHHSSSNLSGTSESAHNSTFLKRRELARSSKPSTNSMIQMPKLASDNRHNTIDHSELDSAKRLQGSTTSLNSTASTGSGSSSSSSKYHQISTTGTTNNDGNPNVFSNDSQLSKILMVSSDDRQYLEPKKGFISAEKTHTSALVEVCSWLERNHLAST